MAGLAEYRQIVERHRSAFGYWYAMVDGEIFGGAAADALAVAL